MAYTRHIKPAWIAAALFGLASLTMLAIRIGFFQAEEPPLPPAAPVTAERETWMNIFQNDRKIGYAYRRLTPLGSEYSFLESANMLINTMGMAQDVHLQTGGILDSDFRVKSFDFNLRSSLFRFKIWGRKEGGTLVLHTGKEQMVIPVSRDLFLTSGATDALLSWDLELNETRTFHMFDPATMGERPVRVTMVGEETLDVLGSPAETRRFSIDFMGTSQSVWIDSEGSVVREDGFMGISLERTTEEHALGGHPLTASTDLTEIVSVPSNMVLEHPDDLSLLRIQVSGIPAAVSLEGGRQSLVGDVLTILKEKLPVPTGSPLADADDYLGSDLLIQSAHPSIVQLASEITGAEDAPLAKARKLMNWVYENIEKRPVLSVPNALETLEKRMGDCNEHAVLMAALARAAGIPAQVEAGLVYARGRFYYHAWNVLHLGQWISVDALMGQMPADVTHIRIVRGEPSQQIDLMGVIGKVGLVILERS